MEKIKLMIIDDDPDWIEAMRLFLKSEEGMVVIATASGTHEAKDLLMDLLVDIILMDIHLSDESYDGIYLAAEISMNKSVKVIMLTSSNEDKCILDSFAAGAIHYVNKSDYRDIPAAVRLVQSSTNPTNVLLRDYSRLRERELLEMLTPNEKEVMQLIEEGYSHQQIQKMLFKSESTQPSERLN